VQDPDPTDLVRITQADNLPPGLMNNPLVPTNAANPVSLNVQGTPATWGPFAPTFRATDTYNESTDHSFTIVVNTPPVITSSPIVEVVAGQLYSYSIVSADPDVSFGDELEIVAPTLPAWLQLTDNGDGTATLSGTPTIADAGQHQVGLLVEDIYHHGYDQSLSRQNFSITVIPCSTVLTGSHTDVSCTGENDGSIELTITGGTGPFTISWTGPNDFTATSQNLTDLPAGLYTAEVIDQNQCVEFLQIALLTVLDITSPTVLVQNITVQLDESGTSTITPAQIDNGSSDNCAIAGNGYSLSKTSFDCSNIGSNTVTLTVTDASGNSGSADAIVTVEDNIAPVPDELQLVPLTSECGLTVPIPTATDNCAGVVSATTTNPTSYLVQGTHTIEWKFDDGNGNTITRSQTIIIDDITQPVLSLQAKKKGAKEEAKKEAEAAPVKAEEAKEATEAAAEAKKEAEAKSEVLVAFQSTITSQCGVTISDVPTAFDNCQGVIEGTTNDPLTYTEQGTYIITWTFDDGNGNILEVDQTIVVDDITAPVPNVLSLPDVVSECGLTLSAPTATDNCKGGIVATTEQPTSYGRQGVYSVTWVYDDGNGNISEQIQTVIVDDVTSPVPDEEVLATLTAECELTLTEPPTATDNCKGSIQAVTEDPVSYSAQGTFTIHWIFDDGNGNSSTQQQVVVIRDVTNPVISPQQNIQVSNGNGICGAVVHFTPPTATDNCGLRSITRSDNTGLQSGDVFPVGTTTLSYMAEDLVGNTSTLSFDVEVSNLAPVINAIVVASGPKPVGTQIPVEISFTDNNLSDVMINWGDGYVSGGTVNADKINASHAYTSTGIYTLQIRITDMCGEIAESIYRDVIVFDSNSGFVTGAGWFNSPAGAYARNPGLAGRATFGIGSMYLKNQPFPSGATFFHFPVANLKLISLTQDWLVISGDKAIFKGTGHVNGVPGYKYLVSAVDGPNAHWAGADKLRIKIWDPAGAILYDNQPLADNGAGATQAIAGGAIVIHSKKSHNPAATSSSSRSSAVSGQSREVSTTAFPNPFVDEITVTLDASVKHAPRFQLMDVTGNAIYDQVHDYQADGIYSFRINDARRGAEVYLLRILQGGRAETLKMIGK
jgi:hypothetical protein